MIADFKMPAFRASELIAKASAFRREGNLVSAILEPEVAGALLDADGPSRRSGTPGRGRNPFDAPIKNPGGSVTFRVEAGLLTEFTLYAQRLAPVLRQRGQARSDDHDEDYRHRLREGRGPGGCQGDRRGAAGRGRSPRSSFPSPDSASSSTAGLSTGWEGRPGFWSVEDRAIVGRTTKENPLDGNTFLFAQSAGNDLIVDDFELRLSYRITADNERGFANSGIQYRSRDRGDFVAAGYQADIEAGPTILGHPLRRGRRRRRPGNHGRSRREGQPGPPMARKKSPGRLGKSEEIQAKIKKDDWNEYVVIARGNHLQHFINGVPTVDVFDDTQAKRLDSGILALQLHAGQPMTVRFKDIRIKSLRSAAESAVGNVRVAKGFKLDQIYSVPKETQGSWVALCVDPKGRLIAADQNGKLYRMTPPRPGRNADRSSPRRSA